MRPVRTTYHLAQNAQEYRLCHELQRAVSPDEGSVSIKFPTVYAVRGGAFIGFLGTHQVDGMIVAGPLVVDPTLRTPAFVMLRLVEAYEAVLAHAHVTEYIVGIEHTNAAWLRQWTERGWSPYAEKDGVAWFIKKVA